MCYNKIFKHKRKMGTDVTNTYIPGTENSNAKMSSYQT